MAMTINELANACGATIEGGNADQFINAANDITAAQIGQVTQLTQARYRHYLNSSQASACFVGTDFDVQDVPASLTLLRCADPEMAFVKAVEILHPTTEYAATIAPQAVIANSAVLHESCHIGAFSVVNDGVEIGENSEILTGVYLGKNVKIGKNCRLYPYVVVYDDVEIGDNVIIHSGAIIGADGFGYVFDQGRHLKVPQIGHVIIGGKSTISP